MKHLASVSLLFLAVVLPACSSSEDAVRPQVDTYSYPDADFSGVLDHDYYTTVADTVDIALKEDVPGRRYLRSSNPEYVPPRYEGGREAFVQTLRSVTSEFTCPVRGVVYVSALLDREGEVHAPQLSGGIHEACDARALDVMRHIEMRPARLDGQPVSTMITQPIRFD